MTPSDLTGLPDNILRKMVEEARAEAARQALLVQRYEPAYLGLPHVVRERNEARAEVERQRTRAESWRERFNSEAGLAGKRQLEAEEWQETARNEMAGRASAEAEVARLEEVEDARSYAAEIAQGVSHYPHEEAEPCVRCRAERAEAKLAVCVEALRECQRVFDHPAFTDRAGIGDVCRAALAAAKGGE